MDDSKKESTVTRYITLAYRILRISRLFWVDNFRNNLVTNIQCGILIIMMAVSSQMEVYQSYKFKDYSTALSNKDFEFFSENLFYFVQIIIFSLPMRVAVLRLEAIILLKWRAWTTGHFMKLYLSNKNYYKFVVNTNNSTSSDLGTEDKDNKENNNNNKNKNTRIDNPDQRISADIDTFTRNTFHYVTDVLDTTIRFVSFAPILWEINPTLFVFLVVYSAVGTYIATFFFGKKMAELNYNSRQLEADFRYSIVRIRDNAESIAFYGGEETEWNDSMANFSKIVNNSKTQQWWSQWLMLFRKFWNFIAQLIPTVITTAQYFEGHVEFGSIAQADIVFNGVKDALFNVIDNFNTITSLYTTVDRLEIFLDEPKVHAEKTKIESKISEDIDFDDVTLKTPNYKRLLWKNVSFALPQGESMLVVGHSGCGKSSLFRALARLWDSGAGTISAPSAKDFFILPQHPYAPLGSLRHLLLYPHFNNYAKETPPTDKEMLEVLQEVNLKSLIDVAGDLEGTVEWSAVLSLGEMQRVSFARLLLAKRKYALLDEATSALDLHNEERMYKLLVDKCPTFISISHRPSLHKFHQFVLEINDEQGYQFSTADKYHFKDE